MTGAGDVDHVEIVLVDHPIEVNVDEVQAGRRSPVPEEPGLDVLLCERLLEQRVVVEIDLTDRQVVGGAPVPIHQCPLFVGQGVCHLSPPPVCLNCASRGRLDQHRDRAGRLRRHEK
jgi:hypothetical protein